MIHNTNILVVDDIEKNLVTMRAVLERDGLTILTAQSGVQALELILTHEVALAIIDVNMPEMDGFELAELLRANPRTQAIPLMFITAALHEPGKTFRGYQAGAVDFLNKPFDPVILRSKVEVFVELFRQRKQLASKLEELENALQLNEMFSAALGHDLRTPLSAVINGAQILSMICSDPKAVDVASRIQSSGQRMSRMVNQLLELARARSDNLILKPDYYNYYEVCLQAAQEFPPTEGNQPVLVDLSGDAVGKFDKESMLRVLSNLIGNAIAHGQQNMPVKVLIDGRNKDTVTLSVHNHGHIPRDQLPKIFAPYHSAQEDNKRNGLGLGLYIVRLLVQAHKGSIEVRSSAMEGTTFELKMNRH